MARAVGIDLGTTFSVVAYLEKGRPVVIPNAEGRHLTPSVVAFRRGGRPLVGELARLQAVANPEGTVFSVKRQMGRRAYLSPLELQRLPPGPELIRQVKRHMGSGCRLRVGDGEYAPEEIAALILQKVKADAEDYLDEAINRAVVSVPAYFNASQRQATIDAAAIAGLEVLRLLDEPTAAALAYGLDLEGVHTVLVWDLGGGTFDVSILELGDGLFEVRAVNGDTWLGGDDYDQRIAEHLARRFQEQHGVDLRPRPAAWRRLQEAAERAKIALTEQERVRTSIPFLDSNRWETTLTRAELEELTDDLRQKMAAPTRQALADAGLRPQEIDRVILVGGATRMPAVRRLARELLGREPHIELHPDEAVALGAAIQAGILTGEIPGKLLLDVTPLSLGIETQDGLFTPIIPRNTTIPISRGQLFTNAADNQTSMDIHVLQGERAMAVDNVTLDRFELAGIPPAPRGEARVEVSFDIDANGILQVMARDLYSEGQQRLRVNPRFYGLPQEEIGRLVEEAARHCREDQERRQEVETGIRAENVVRAARRVLDEAPPAADPSHVEQIEQGIWQLQAALASADRRQVQARTEDLERLLPALAPRGLPVAVP